MGGWTGKAAASLLQGWREAPYTLPALAGMTGFEPATFRCVTGDHTSAVLYRSRLPGVWQMMALSFIPNQGSRAG